MRGGHDLRMVFVLSEFGLCCYRNKSSLVKRTLLNFYHHHHHLLPVYFVLVLSCLVLFVPSERVRLSFSPTWASTPRVCPQFHPSTCPTCRLSFSHHLHPPNSILPVPTPSSSKSPHQPLRPLLSTRSPSVASDRAATPKSSQHNSTLHRIHHSYSPTFIKQIRRRSPPPQ